MKLATLAVLTLATVACAQDAPKQVPEVSRLRLVNQYMKTFNANQAVATAKDAACAKDPECQKAQTDFNADYAALKALFEETKKELALTSAQDLVIDVKAPKESDQVRVVAAQVQPPPTPTPVQAPKGK